MSVSLVKRVSYSAMLRTMRLPIWKTYIAHAHLTKHIIFPRLKDIHSFCFHDSYLLKPTCITRKKPFIRFSSFELWENRFESWEVKEQYLMKPVLGRGVFNTLILRFLNNKTFMGCNTKIMFVNNFAEAVHVKQWLWDCTKWPPVFGFAVLNAFCAISTEV